MISASAANHQHEVILLRIWFRLHPRQSFLAELRIAVPSLDLEHGRSAVTCRWLRETILRGSSEHELQSKLQLTHIGSRRADPAKLDARKRRIRFSPVRMVEEVERLEAEFQIPLLAEMKPLRHREVPVFDSGADHFAASGRAEGAVRRS